jgi:hypothetical protein
VAAEQRTRGRGRAVVVAAVGVAAVLSVAAIPLLRSGEDSGSRSVAGSRSDATLPSTPAASSSSTPAPAVSPSLTIAPTSGLRDGDVVSFSGAGFDANSTVTVNLCADDPTLERGRCDTSGTAVEVPSSGSGTIEGAITVHQWIFGQHGFVDCAQADAACSLLPIAGTGPGVGQRVEFDAAVARPEPGLTIDVAGPYRPNQEVVLRGSGFPVEAHVGIAMCEAGVSSDERHCIFQAAGSVTVDRQGQFTAPDFVLIAQHPSAGLDCAGSAEGCELAWYPTIGTPAYATLRVNFAN